MKTFLVSSIFSILLAANAIAAGQTNIIDVQLLFLSQSTNYTTYATNKIISWSGSRAARVYTTNFVVSTNIVAKAAQEVVRSRDVIDAIATNAPKESTLALLTDSSGSNSVFIQADNTNFMDVTNFTFTVVNAVYAGTEVLTADADVLRENSQLPQETDLITVSLATPALSFKVTGVAKSFAERMDAWGDDDLGFVVGSGSDAVGTNEIVTGNVFIR